MAEGTRRILPLVLSALLLQPLLQAQSSAPVPSQLPPSVIAYDTQALPPEPSSALVLIGKANGLGSEDLKPWYLKAPYQTYDAAGKPLTQGIIEIWRSSEQHYRVTYTSDAFTQTNYRTPQGRLQVGSPGHVPYAESLLLDELLHPAQSFREGMDIKRTDKKIGNLEMVCLSPPAKNVPAPDLWCLDKSSQLALRVSERNGYSTIFNKIELFQHRFVGGEVSMFDFGQPVLKYSIEKLRAMSSADQTLLEPPAGASLETAPSDAKLDGPSTSIKPTVMAGRILSKTPPRYPAEAKQRRAQGTVRIRATISKDGTVLSPFIVRDPDPALSRAALDAVRQWRYDPYLLNGAPVEVLTTITVTFTLGG